MTPGLWIPDRKKLRLPPPCYPVARCSPSGIGMGRRPLLEGGGVAIPNPTSYWTMNEAVGARVDSAGAVNLPSVGTPPFAPGLPLMGTAPGSAFTNTSYFRNTTTGYTPAGAWELGLWINLSSIAAFAVPWYAGGAALRIGSASANGIPRFIGSSNLDWTAALSTSVWYAISLGYDGANMFLSVNAAPVVTAANTAPPSTDWSFGDQQGAGFPFAGQIAHVAYWQGFTLTPTQRTAWYNAGSPKVYYSGSWHNITSGPAGLGTIIGWLSADVGTYQDSSRTTPAVANNDPVGGFLDQSGNLRHGSQNTAGLRPLLKTALYNSKSAIRFDGISQILNISWAPGNNALMVLVATPSSVANSYLAGGSYTDGSPAFISAYASKAYEWYNFLSGAGDRQTFQASASGPHILSTAQIDPGVGGQVLTLYYDGVQQYTGIPTVALLGRNFTNLGGTTAGSAPAGYDLLEKIIFSPGLSTADHATLISYLKTKWGIP